MTDESEQQHDQPLPLFFLGLVVLTPGALRVLADADKNLFELLRQHQYGEWSLKDETMAAVQLGMRVFSAHVLPTGEKLWIMTEGTRASTLVVLPSEFAAL
ncbi:MAG: hypothetical protein ACM359_24465 [Bacillota bacterium]